MECHYHPEREGTDVCAICGKSICKECGLEIAGKVYCKDCLEKIVGLGIDSSQQEAPQQPTAQPQEVVAETPVQEAEKYAEEYLNESIYQPQEEYEIPYAEEEPVQEYKAISDDSPYNVRDTVEYSGGLESSYISENEPIYQEEPQVAQQEHEYIPQETIQQQPVSREEEFIYPDHDYEPPTTNARQNLEDKYEKYLDDLYFDENEVPLGEQLAKDEAQYGSLTKKEYRPRPTPQPTQQQAPQRQVPRNETPEEMEARIRAEIAQEMSSGKKIKDTADKKEGIHDINYKDEKEPMGAVDILLTIILIIVILIVLYYIIYLFLLQATYPTFMDAIFALQNPQNVINHLLTPQP
ncbi:hypothetical protein [Methanobrevibacter sp.]|uniref:hypothetical protein n=1 Tax=Methanobrevibacter sp. TaxID=66852 RepID=UPI00388CF1C0